MKQVAIDIGWVIAYTLAAAIWLLPLIVGVPFMLSQWTGSWTSRLLRLAAIASPVAAAIFVALIELGIRQEWDSVLIALGISVFGALGIVLMGSVFRAFWSWGRRSFVEFVCVMAYALAAPSAIQSLPIDDDTQVNLRMLVWSSSLFMSMWIGKRAYARRKLQCNGPAST